MVAYILECIFLKEHACTLDYISFYGPSYEYVSNLSGNGLAPNRRHAKIPGPRHNIKPSFPGMGIPMLKIRRSCDRLIFTMGSLYW